MMSPDRIPPRCAAIQALFSAYLDGAVSGRRMQSIAAHLESCPSCTNEFSSLREMQRSLGSLGPVKPPADLAMRLRIAISHESARRTAGRFDGLRFKWQNAIRPIVLQASAGFAGTIVLIGSVLLLLGVVASPDTVMADENPDGLTTPHYLYSAGVPRPVIDSHDTTVVVQAYVNSQGRVYDFKIVSGPEDPVLRTQIANELLLSVFEPARIFGTPTRGQAVLTFSGVSVSG
jgi:anti-sigma factor RsiW